MRFTQVKEMFEQVGAFHGQLADYYEHLSDSTDQQRVKLLLDHLGSHERHLEETLKAYEGDTTRHVMDTYVDCVGCDEIFITCQQTPVTPDMTVQGVIGTAMDVDRCLQHFYRQVADKADSEAVREIFENLIEQEESELRNLALDALGGADM
jgi:succinate dehydrogenase flavin-adding protein (antitoxin of CptAB toxin-antitoxin module)